MSIIKGIDVSHWDAQLNANNMATVVQKNNLYFNYIKATDGITADATFSNFWKMSKDAGLLCGAFHFFRPSINASVQAHHFLDTYSAVSHAGALPMSLDIEWTKSNNSPETWAQVPPQNRTKMVLEFLSVVEAELHVKPIIYLARAFWNEFFEVSGVTASDRDAIGSFGIWLVDLNNTNPLPSPWTTKEALIKQNHFGENATTQDPYDKTDQDAFVGDVKSLLNSAAPGLAFAKSNGVSNINRDIQQALTSKGFDTKGIDGDFGNNTQKAVMAFQAANGLFANGIVDAQTWNKLL